MADTTRGDWQCPNAECYNHTNYPQAYVYGSNPNCKKCGTGRNATRPGDWCCPNMQCINNKNCVYASKPICPKCGTPRPNIGAGRAGGGGMPPAVPMHLQQGFGGGGGGGCGGSRPGDWHCANPDCKNHTGNVVFANKTSCPICGWDKPEEPVMASRQPVAYPQFGGNVGGFAMGGKGGGRPGDWNCPNASCKNHVENVVYGSKTHCPLCNTAKPANGGATNGFAGRGGGVGGGRAGGGGVGPTMRPGDWHCPNESCRNHTNNVVYANKLACPLCGQSKPSEDRDRSWSPQGVRGRWA